MPCFHPIPGWLAKRVNESGKRGIVFDVSAGFKDKPVEVPCGKCVGCRLERSRQWAVRCLHESKLHDSSLFVTLTYETVPPGGSLRPRDFVLFMKRLRITHPGVRFFQCGEYGEQLSRPHHHAILFNCFFSDQRYYKSRGDIRLYTSKELEKIWTHGQCSVGQVTFESAAYVARYAMKKVYGNNEAYYGGRVPEYVTMSRRPGIGSVFVDRFRKDIYPCDEVIVRGVRCRPPKYYDGILERDAPTAFAKLKRRRRVVQAEHIAALGGEHENAKKLIVREVVKRAAISHLVRDMEVCRD